MIEYKVYIIGKDGHFIGFEPVQCKDDNEATEKAKEFLNGHDIELWNGNRFVVRLTHRTDMY